MIIILELGIWTPQFVKSCGKPSIYGFTLGTEPRPHLPSWDLKRAAPARMATQSVPTAPEYIVHSVSDARVSSFPPRSPPLKKKGNENQHFPPVNAFGQSIELGAAPQGRAETALTRHLPS